MDLEIIFDKENTIPNLIFKTQKKWFQLFGKYFTKSECVCWPIRICWVRERDLSPSLAVSGFWLFPVSPNLRPVLGTNGPTQGAYLGKDSSNGNFREMVEISTTTMQIQIKKYTDTNTETKSISLSGLIENYKYKEQV